METAMTGGRNQVTTGIGMMCAGVVCLCLNDAIAKTLTADYSPIQILFLRNLIALPIAVLIALKMGGRSALISHRPAAHLLRGVLWLCAATLFFTGLSLLGLAEATALIFVMPVFVTALSALVLREQVGWRRWTQCSWDFWAFWWLSVRVQALSRQHRSSQSQRLSSMPR